MDYSSDKIVLNFYTNQQYVLDQCKPQLAKKWIPEWWKKLPASRTETDLHTEGSPVPVSSMKQCPAINEILKQGVIIPSWCELHLECGPNGQLNQRVFPEHTALLPHDEQDWNFHKPGYAHVKVGSPWLMKEETGVQFMWIKPEWHHKDPLAYWGVPGIIEYKYQHALLNNIMIPFNSRVKINTGDPWLQIIPLSDKPIEIKCHLVSAEEMSRLNTTNISSVGSYAKSIHNRKRQEERDKHEDN